MIALLYGILYRSARLVMFFLEGFFPKVQKGFELRERKDGLAPWLNFPKNTNPIWIHAPSGEFEYALPVIREIKKQHPEVKVMVTYYTPSYVHRIAKEPLVDFYAPLPWDTAVDITEFLEHHRPRQLLIARTGVWPEMTRQCADRGVPVSIFSMTFNKRASLWNTMIYRWLFRHVNHFYVVSEDDKKALRKIAPEWAIDVLGDSRYDQCLFRLSHESPVKIARDLLPKKVFVSASTWPEDEAVLLPFIREHAGDVHWIVVPHEMDKEHIENVQKQLAPLKTTLYSQIHTWNGEGVLIVDEFGVLAALYKIADGAFVGGSFKARVHSVMESIACGNITFVGPHHTNNREALEFLQFKKTSIAPVQILSTSEDTKNLLPKLSTWSSHDRELLKKAFMEKTGASQHLVEEIL